MKLPTVTVVVTPRERFSCATRSLSSLAASASGIDRVIYLDAGTPPSVRSELRVIATQCNLNLDFLEAPKLTTPNRLRNLGAQEVSTKYVCFVDNDLIFTNGWLEHLLVAAEEEGAAVAFPLYLIGEFESDRIHMAGGEIHLSRKDGATLFDETHKLANQSFSTHKHSLRREGSDYGEFHCILVRTDVLRQVGSLDEGLPSLNEHLDLCMKIERVDGKIIFEPASVVSYVPASASMPFWLSDVEFFSERWSQANNLQSIRHFYEKWDFYLDESNPPPALRFGNWQRQQIFDLLPRSTPASNLETVYSQTDYPYVHSFPRLALQCFKLGFSEQELTRLRRAFDLAASVHGGAIRKCRLMFIDHCVGVASILAHHAANCDLVIAGLLHAIYLRGTTAKNAILSGTPADRRFVCSVAGRQVESVVFEYANTNFFGNDYWTSVSTEPELTRLDVAASLVLRVANEVEECLDFKLVLDGKSKQNHLRSLLFERSRDLLDLCGYGPLGVEALQRIRLLALSGPAEAADSLPSWLINQVSCEEAMLPPPGKLKKAINSVGRTVVSMLPPRIRSSDLMLRRIVRKVSRLADYMT